VAVLRLLILPAVLASLSAAPAPPDAVVAVPAPTGLPAPPAPRSAPASPSAPAVPPSSAVPPTAAALLDGINSTRLAAGVAPLAHAAELDRVAQERAETIGRQGAMPGEAEAAALFGRVSRLLAVSGYHAHAWMESATVIAGDAGAVVDSWKQDASFAEAMRAELRDVGFGAATYNGVPLYVFFFAWPEHDYYARQVAPLADLRAVRAALLSGVNAARAGAGLSALAADPRLDAAAQAHAADMLERSYYAHQGPDGTSPRQRILAAGFPTDLAGENIAARHTSPGEALAGWLASSAHRRNILDPRFTHLGVGLAVGPLEHRYQILWVEDFAAAAPPSGSAGSLPGAGGPAVTGGSVIRP
jgi:uncharacterized protein YkwD